MPRTRSLRLALLLSVVLPLLLALGAAGYLGLRTVEGWVEARMQEEVKMIAQAIHPPLSRSLERDRQGTVQRTLESAFDLSPVYAVYVYDLAGDPIVTVGVPDDPKPERLADLAVEGDRREEYGEVAGREVYSYFVPLSDSGGRPIGLLQLTRRRSDFDRQFRTLRLQGAGALLLGAIVMTPLVLVGHRRSVGRHLSGLGGVMARVAEGREETRASTGGPAEVATLATGLNAMLDSMAAARTEIEARRDAQLALEQRLKQAEKLAAIGRLAAGVAHELGSPLSVIDGKAVRALREADLSPEAAVALRQIREEVRRMEAIVGQLLDFGRGGETAEPTRVALADVLGAAAEAVGSLLEERGASLDVERPGPELVVRGDARRLERAVANLVRNAIQAAPGGHVGLAARAEGEGQAVIEVVDDGPGVPEEIRSRIFEPFFTTKPVGEGTGLGLAVVHGIVEGHGGAVRVEEGPAGGARFQVELPRAEETA